VAPRKDDGRMQSGCHQLTIMYTQMGEFKRHNMPIENHIELYRWAHIVISVDGTSLSVLINGDQRKGKCS